MATNKLTIDGAQYEVSTPPRKKKRSAQRPPRSVESRTKSTKRKAVSSLSPRLPAIDERVINDYDPRLAFDVAVGVRPLDEIAAAYNMSEDELKALMQTPTLKRDIQRFQEKATRDGTSFQLKTQVMAEHYLTRLHELIMDPITEPAVVRGSINDVVTWAGWSNKGNNGQTSSPIINLNINI